MLDQNLLDTLRTHLAKIIRPIEVAVAADDSATSTQMRELIDEIASLSPSITVVDDETPDVRRPSFDVRHVGSDIHVRFVGVPLGHEFTSLVLALLQVGGHPSTASQEVLDQIRSIDRDLVFETFFSLSCQNCPDVVQALNLMSVVNPRIRHVAIDGALVQDELHERGVMSVPAVFLNGEAFGQGRMTLEQIVAALDPGAAARAAARIDDLDPFDMLIVGGGPAGSSAAIYAARKGIRTGVVAERFGGQVLDTLGIENLISVSHTDGPHLAAALEQHVRSHEVDVMDLQRAVRLVPGRDIGDLVIVELESGAHVSARTVVLSTGARWRRMGVPGEEEYRNRGVAYCPHCDGPLFAGRRVAVIGGGNSGVEAAIDLAGLASHVTLVEFADELRADAVLQQSLRALDNVTMLTSTETTEVIGDGDRVTGLALRHRHDGLEDRIDLEGVFVQIGLLPNTEWLEGVLDLNPRGEIVVDDRGATSVPGVFAAGDCTTTPYKQIVIALGAGATAALGAFDHLIRTRDRSLVAA